jgi:hypothetical protein
MKIEINSLADLYACIMDKKTPISIFPRLVWETFHVVIGAEEGNRILLVDKLKDYYKNYGNLLEWAEHPIFLDELDLNVKN